MRDGEARAGQDLVDGVAWDEKGPGLVGDDEVRRQLDEAREQGRKEGHAEACELLRHALPRGAEVLADHLGFELGRPELDPDLQADVAEEIPLEQFRTRDLEIFTNCRGYAAGQPLDGHLDGWNWQAWAGSTIAYGSSQDHAIENLKAKLSDSRAVESVAVEEIPLEQFRTVLLDQVLEWHLRMFPEAEPQDCILKAYSELAELGEADFRRRYVSAARARDGVADGDLSSPVRAEIEREVGDVLICLFAYCGRVGVDPLVALITRWEEIRHRPVERVRRNERRATGKTADVEEEEAP